jgi:tripartite-type tricarboxylate transporter receptor subunit TctC
MHGIQRSLLLSDSRNALFRFVIGRHLPRRAFVHCIAVCVMFLAPIALAQQKYPSKPIRVVVVGTAGSTTDILARVIGNKMSESWGQPVVIDNRVPLIAINLVAKSAPDGYALLLTSAAMAVRAVLTSNLPYDTTRDFAGVTEIGFGNTLVVVSPGLGVKSVKELVAYAQARPGKIFNATGATGDIIYLTGETFKFAAGIKAQHVSFKGQAETLIEIAAGRSHFTTSGQTAALPFIKDGKLVALVQQAPGLPDVPMAADVLPQWKQMGRNAILAPSGTPLAIRQQISKEVARILSLPDVRERLNILAYHIAPTTPEEHERTRREEIAAFAKVVKDIGLKPN